MGHLIYTLVLVATCAEIKLTSLTDLESFFDGVTDYTTFERNLADYWSTTTEKVQDYKKLLENVQASRREFILLY